MINAMQSNIRGQLLSNEPMAKHCSWRTGGVAEFYYEPFDKDDLILFLKSQLSTKPVLWLGLGSNLLVRDGGIKGLVIAGLNKLNKITLIDDLIYAESGVTCSKLARFCEKQALTGAEFLAGIPGTVGGALAMNAGAFGSETWQFVESVEMMNRQGDIEIKKADEFKVSYRHVEIQNDQWFSAGLFNFSKNKDHKRSNIKQLIQKRNASQPIGLPSCGSVFKNPEGDYAARLIEESGLKGYCNGGACISEKHSNFIINTNNASATDIEDLIELIKKKVSEKFNINLETEVRIIGDRL